MAERERSECPDCLRPRANDQDWDVYMESSDDESNEMLKKLCVRDWSASGDDARCGRRAAILAPVRARLREVEQERDTKQARIDELRAVHAAMKRDVDAFYAKANAITRNATAFRCLAVIGAAVQMVVLSWRMGAAQTPPVVDRSTWRCGRCGLDYDTCAHQERPGRLRPDLPEPPPVVQVPWCQCGSVSNDGDICGDALPCAIHDAHRAKPVLGPCGASPVEITQDEYEDRLRREHPDREKFAAVKPR